MGIETVAAAAFLGGLTVALAGWAESQEPFSPRKFMASMLRSLLAAAVFAAAYQTADKIGFLNLLQAFLGGAGVDSLGNRLSTKLAGRGSFPL